MRQFLNDHHDQPFDPSHQRRVSLKTPPLLSPSILLFLGCDTSLRCINTPTPHALLRNVRPIRRFSAVFRDPGSCRSFMPWPILTRTISSIVKSTMSLTTLSDNECNPLELSDGLGPRFTPLLAPIQGPTFPGDVYSLLAM
ncbi:Hypothetical protein NTJ_12509 [Nesidiocoris tenuis]|uniref:Uncharacterized protein n=1 Tax=Nesidiocoris tenuis TaxID=355587 RepID=A0ABN7B7Q4_9HEMI|nr:Hypothetical protein NTJ_12509 [Nesidiocoris tenuis]